MVKTKTSWKILLGLVIVAVVFVVASYKKTDPNVEAPIPVATPDASMAGNLMIACAAPGKNQVMATASSTKRLMWAATPSIEGKVVEGAIIEWSLVTPEKKILQTSKDIGLTYYVERTSFPAGIKKQTYTMQAKVTAPTGQTLTATCATVDVTLQ